VLPAPELARLGEIDRSEHISELYAMRDGVLEVRAVDEDSPRWSDVPARIAEWAPLLERGGTLLGALDGDRLAGIAIYRPNLVPYMANLAVLHVSRAYRRRGVASGLTNEVIRLARADGAKSLYVSATPTGSAVGFYRSVGFVPTTRPNPEMFALEPEDIHMILAL
jgi:ribosomal protein S18 acetylase RimI-like enzyme